MLLPKHLNRPLSRRSLLAAAGGTVAALAARRPAGGRQPDAEGIESIERQVVFAGRQKGPTWFHPRGCVIPARPQVRVLMTLQTIGGSDVFGPVHWTESDDLGKSWTGLRPLPGLGRRTLESGYEVGVCDVVPEYHAATQSVLAIGHNVYYQGGKLARPQPSRWPVYVVRSADGHWSSPRRLDWDDPRSTAIYTCNCAQRATLDDGDVLVPLSFGPRGRTARSATTARCTFDGRQLTIRQAGTELTNSTGRGFLEPSLLRLQDRFLMTLRAEDGRGYVSDSADGLQWSRPRPWAWDNGQPLTMSTTQQRWLAHSSGPWLVYTRKDASNARVFRWRAPLYVARVDPATLRLVRDTERVVFPLRGSAETAPQHVARMGNFHTVAVTAEESWVTVGETLPEDGWRGDTLLARIRWCRPNRLAPESFDE